MKRISRRKFLKCIGTGTAAVAAMGLLGGCSGASVDSKVYQMNEKVTANGVEFVMESAEVMQSQRPFFDAEEYKNYVPLLVHFKVKNKSFQIVHVIPNSIDMQDWLNGENGGIEKLYKVCKDQCGFASTCGNEALKCFGYGQDDDCGGSVFKIGEGGILEWFIWAPKGWTTLDLYYSPYFLEGKTLHFSLSTSEVKVN